MPRETRSAADMGDNIAKALRAGRAGVPRDLDRVGALVVGDLRLTLSRPGAGRVYETHFFTDPQGRLRRGRRRSKPHQASAPGDPPAVDTGRLRASYGHKATRTPAGGDLEIASGDEKAPLLEFGTSRMEPRPHLRPVIARWAPRIRQAVADGVEARERAMARRLGGTG